MIQQNELVTLILGMSALTFFMVGRVRIRALPGWRLFLFAFTVLRERSADALRVSEERYRTLAEETPVLICGFLPGGEITYTNEAYCRYFGKTSGELLGSSFLSLIPEADRETVIAGISSMTVTSPSQSHEHRVILPTGEVRWQRWTNRAQFDADGRQISCQAIGEDITERQAGGGGAGATDDGH